MKLNNTKVIDDLKLTTHRGKSQVHQKVQLLALVWISQC